MRWESGDYAGRPDVTALHVPSHCRPSPTLHFHAKCFTIYGALWQFWLVPDEKGVVRLRDKAPPSPQWKFRFKGKAGDDGSAYRFVIENLRDPGAGKFLAVGKEIVRKSY